MIMTAIDFALRGEFITLEALLKASGLAGGGAAKLLIAEGGASVNGDVERRRGRKLRPGDEVVVGASRVCVRTSSQQQE